jgi:malate dehydrogenase
MADAVTGTRKIAIEVIGLKGATTHGPGGAVARMVESIVYDKKELLPVSAYLTGEYGVQDLCIGVPAVLGRNGLERVVELELTSEERAVFQQGVTALREAVGSLTLPPPRPRS